MIDITLEKLSERKQSQTSRNRCLAARFEFVQDHSEHFIWKTIDPLDHDVAEL